MKVLLFLLSVLLVGKVITFSGVIDAVTISPIRGSLNSYSRS